MSMFEFASYLAGALGATFPLFALMGSRRIIPALWVVIHAAAGVLVSLTAFAAGVLEGESGLKMTVLIITAVFFAVALLYFFFKALFWKNEN